MAANEAGEGLSDSQAARMWCVQLERIAWLVTVGLCLIAVVVLVLQGYLGYAGVTAAVAIAAGINLL